MLTITFQFTDIASAAALLAKLNGHEVAAMVPPSPAPEVAAAPVEKPKATKSTSAATTAAPAPTPRTAEAVADAAPAKTADALASSNAASAEAQPPASTAAAEPFPYAKLQALVFKHLPAHGQVAVLQVAEKHGAAKFKELPANKWRAAHDDLVALFGE